MTWEGDRSIYVSWLEEQLYPSDWAKQALVSWAILAENFTLTYDTEQDVAALRAHLAHEVSALFPN